MAPEAGKRKLTRKGEHRFVWGRSGMRHIFMGLGLLLGGLLATSTAAGLLQSWATARASSTEYEPPALATPAGAQSLKPASENAANNPQPQQQRTRARSAPRPAGQEIGQRA